MTWVVGTPCMFGYGIGISDIRVSFGDNEREVDCLRKIYPVGRSIAAGFAGSVRIGFAMIDRLKELLYSPDESGMWDPLAVAEWWPQDAQEVFGRFPKAEQHSGCEIMLISVAPSEHTGNPSWPRSYVHTFCAPDFKAAVAEPHEVLAIGCGNAVKPCRDAVDKLSSDREVMFSMMQGEQGVRGGMATLLGFHLTTILKQTQPRGISSHLHYCWVYHDRIVIKANDHMTIGRWTSFSTGVDAPEQTMPQSGSEASETAGGPIERSDSAKVFSMPRIAKSWQELQEILEARGAAAVGLVG